MFKCKMFIAVYDHATRNRSIDRPGIVAQSTEKLKLVVVVMQNWDE